MRNHTIKQAIRLGAIALLAACTATLAAAAGKPTTECRDAEASFSEAQVLAAEAYASNDFDKAKAAIEKAKASLQKGRETSTSCGCEAAIDPAKKTAGELDDAMQTSHFNEIQERLYSLIGTGEQARAAAEVCWRQAATAGAAVAAAPAKAPTK